MVFTLSSKLQELGFVPSKVDVSLFILNQDGVSMYIIIYVDDIIIISSTTKATDLLLQQLRIDFAVKDLGVLSYFLGIEVNRVSNGIILSQYKCIQDLLHKNQHGECQAGFHANGSD